MNWTVTAYPDERGTFRVIAVDPARRRVLHRDRLTAEQVAAFDPAAEWAGPRKPGALDADIAAALGGAR